ncbi:hypothetical protein Z517_10877 [Fonsecaea pedrosoi CBS 271.37]|uniref:Unplaced genomic scaffold supercont1.7, whole genome shotgun sequence n=1 Tax=Fonsecaea pedrosoi CBS 271.37 TaxID=1442368 RepID=A0A0D2EP25_9EURO|nr:uncharacterized protein Z517_10877 [Fonsecaea pedrosoi CBS 271.37]KIW76132.1 hypothetical protein Z517_10877 [Fonsecaea pedrosoi CBS 271.37]
MSLRNAMLFDRALLQYPRDHFPLPGRTHPAVARHQQCLLRIYNLPPPTKPPTLPNLPISSPVSQFSRGQLRTPDITLRDAGLAPTNQVHVAGRVVKLVGAGPAVDVGVGDADGEPLDVDGAVALVARAGAVPLRVDGAADAQQLRALAVVERVAVDGRHAEPDVVLAQLALAAAAVDVLGHGQATDPVEGGG